MLATPLDNLQSAGRHEPSTGDFHEVASDGLVSAALAPPDARLPDFLDARHEPRAALAKLRAAVVGAGSVGMRICTHLARLGIAELSIVDSATLKSESLLTHPIYPADIGKSKA